MRSIDVGILLSDKVEFCLNGDFQCCGATFNGNGVAVASAGRVEWMGGSAERVVLKPNTPASTFTICNVVIGIDFHWQRCEQQTFSGELHLFVENGKLRVVNRVAIEEYLVSVISSEMSATSSLQLLKAHAVVSRSWVYAQLQRAQNAPAVTASVCGSESDGEIVRWYEREDHHLFDFCADDHCQRYQGVTRVMNPAVVRAVKETEGMVVASDGCVCDARFSKCCGGITELFSSCWGDKDVPYLASFRDSSSREETFDASDEQAARHWIESVPDAFCSVDDATVLSQVLNGYDRETNDFYRWTVTYTQDELSALLRRKSGINFGIIKDLVPLERGRSGRIVRLKIVGDKKSIIVGKELEIRRWLSPTHLYSSAFVVDKKSSPNEDTLFVLKGAGWGHGVGLCQIGAAMMGERGYDYTEILAHYYPKTDLKNINELI